MYGYIANVARSSIVITVSRCIMAWECGSSTAMIFSACAGGEELLGEILDTHRRAALAHADHHGAVTEHLDVAALERRRLVRCVVASVPDVEARLREHRVELVDGGAVDRSRAGGPASPSG